MCYHDSPLFRGRVPLRVSGRETVFKAHDAWLDDLGKIERFAVRRGTIGFRGWIPKAMPIAGTPLTDSDFRPNFEQKGVDMRIGLDIANFAHTKAVDRIILVSGDQDMVPAMKQARKAGLELAIVQLDPPVRRIHDELKMHADLVRTVRWP